MVTKTEIWTELYKGQIEPWKIHLAISRIKTFGFPKPDWLNILQELAMVLMNFTFEPAKANGAKQSTALCAVIDRQLKTMIRAEVRESAKIHRYAQNLLHTSPAVVDGHDLGYMETTPLRMDVREAVGHLTPFQRAICEGLGNGKSAHQIAKELGVGWHTVKRAIALIRMYFAGIGLGGWVRR